MMAIKTILKIEAVGDDIVAALRYHSARPDDSHSGMMRRRLDRALEKMGHPRPAGWRYGACYTGRDYRAAARILSPWVAEIVGRDGMGQLQRQFVSGQKDYTHADRVGSRGVFFFYHLTPGHIYEVNSHPEWKRHDHYLCRVRHDGHIVKITPEDACQLIR